MNKVDREGMSPLHWASWAGQRSHVLELLKSHADNQHKDYVDGKIVMQSWICGTESDDEGVVKTLGAFIDSGSAVNFQDEDGGNPLALLRGIRPRSTPRRFCSSEKRT